ncbi:MAG: M24 family metallopeptidase [Steroidobacteraceae bacterium]
MTTISRRDLLGTAIVLLASGQVASARASSQATGGSVAGAVEPIGAAEHEARTAKLQSLLQKERISALVVEAGSSLEYFTGIRWWRSERTTAAIIPAEDTPIVVTPFFEVPSVQETLKIKSDVRPWHEDESPFEIIAKSLSGVATDRALAVEHTTRHFIIDHVQKVKGFNRKIVSGEDLVNACRMIKSPAELALMQAAADVTIRAIRHVHANLKSGMTAPDIREMLHGKTEELGGAEPFSLVLLNEASAYPHGTEKPQSIREGSIVLIDTGCKLQGYSSDISRTWVFGEPSGRQREVWDTVKRGQEICLETAKIGQPVGDIDIAVRNHYEEKGWARNYGLPGTSHRTGHGIGMDGHEPPNLMRADRTPLQAGMCFSDEPGIYIPGEFGVRMEDCWHMTEPGPSLFTTLAKSIDAPI